MMKDIRVLDMTRWLAGSYAALLLAHLGAETIKLEKPDGEHSRHVMGPFDENGFSTWFAAFNYNKKSITLNLREDAGRELFKKLIKDVDVLVQNYRPGTLDSMGLGYDVLSEINPRLVQISVSGYGQYGPNKNRPAHDQVLQAESGLSSLTGEPDGAPMKTATSITDYMTGIFGAVGALGALVDRETTGKGKVVDVALYDSMVSVMENFISQYPWLGTQPPRSGNRREHTVPTNVFPTNDGYVYTVTATDDYFRRLTAAIGRPELATDPKYATKPARMASIDELEEIISSFTRAHSKAEVLSAFWAQNYPGAAVNTVPEVAESDQVKARDLLLELIHPEAGRMVVPAVPIKYVGETNALPTPPPTIGEHNHDVFGGLLGLTDDEIDALRSEGVI